MTHEAETWHTPPEYQGQGVEVQYRYHPSRNEVWRRTIDHGDEHSIRDYEWADAEDDAFTVWGLDFWNGIPRPVEFAAWWPADFAPAEPWNV